ncbi:MAG: hypothetical protein JNK14_12555 [Chitinophagaceae bacterium]|nr:hypothetical protein [Chitinophagaceae bacterium]
MGQYRKPITSLLALSIFFIVSCSKSSDGPSGPYDLSYGDSIIYLKVQSGDYIVKPTEHRAGIYEGFPDGIEIDDVTGEINVSKSETGLRYRITHTAPDGTITTAKVVLSGITFPDKYYHLSQNDSIAFPVYNADVSRILPVTGSIFDEGNGANTGGCSVKTTNGQINLKETIRNGVFGSTPQNDVRKDFDIAYRLNDASGKAVNKIRVRLYYYERMSDVPADLLETLQDRADQGVFLRTTGTARIAKPRPPCVIIVNQ